MIPVIRTRLYSVIFRSNLSKVYASCAKNINILTSIRNDPNKLQICSPKYIVFRYKSKSKKMRTETETEDEDADLAEAVIDKNSKIINVNASSLRADILLKAGLGIARNKIETLFYESKIRVNGEKLLKKSTMVNEGDELDIVKGVSPSNPDFLVVARVEVLSAKQTGEGLSVKLRRWKSLIIENYAEPWKGGPQK